MGEDLATQLGAGAVGGFQQTQPNRGGGFFQWLGANYGQLTDSFRDVACIIKPETCRGGSPGGQPPVIVQQDNSSKVYFLILGALILVILVVILFKK